jgi:dolichol-phosphate mannosyltransferase
VISHDSISTASDAATVSFVIPAMNEAESIEELHRGIIAVCEANSTSRQIILVDDGSTDSTWQVMERLVAGDRSTEAIRFRRNFGKAAALSAGTSAADGQIVITMDADLQDDPQEIPRFLDKMDEGYGVVSGWKEVRHDPWHKTMPSRVFNWLVSNMTGVRLHDHNCGFKAYRREIFDEIHLYGELHRFVPVLAAARGWRIGEIPVQHRARPYGQSKYGVSRLIKGFLDLLTVYLLTGFSSRPQHLIGSIGIFFFSVGGIGLSVLSALWVISRLTTAIDVVHLHETAIFYYCILALLFGAQFLLAGLLSELIVSRTRDANSPYSIAERSKHESSNAELAKDRQPNA